MGNLSTDVSAEIAHIFQPYTDDSRATYIIKSRSRNVAGGRIGGASSQANQRIRVVLIEGGGRAEGWLPHVANVVYTVLKSFILTRLL